MQMIPTQNQSVEKIVFSPLIGAGQGGPNYLWSKTNSTHCPEPPFGFTATAQSPCRVDLFGNWSDDSEWLNSRPSRVVSCAVRIAPRRLPTEVSLTLLHSPGIKHDSYDIRAKGNLRFRDAIRNPVTLAVLHTLGIEDEASFEDCSSRRPGLLISTRSDVPFRSGLGASSSLTVCARAACLALMGVRGDPRDIAEACFSIEHRVHKVGWQDHYAASFGGANVIARRSGDHHAVVQTLSPDVGHLLKDHAVLAYLSGRPHGSLPWPDLTPTVIGRLDAMDRIVEEFLRAQHNLTIGHLLDFLERHWSLAQHWYSPHLVTIARRTACELRSSSAIAVVVGAGPAALVISNEPAQVTKRCLRHVYGLQIRDLRPCDEGVSVSCVVTHSRSPRRGM